MKKIILFLSLFCILCIPSQVNAYNYENISQIEYLEDGSYIETTIFVSNDYARSQKTASKIARYNSSTGVQQWYVTVTGTSHMGMDQQNVFHHQLSQVYIIINGLFRVNLLLNQEQQQ